MDYSSLGLVIAKDKLKFLLAFMNESLMWKTTKFSTCHKNNCAFAQM